MKLFIIFTIIFLSALESHSLKILGIFPIPGKSHYILARSLMRGLAEKGHDVTVINPFGEKDPPKNGTYRDILLTEDPSAETANHGDFFEIDKMNFIMYQLFMNFLGNMITEKTISHPNVQKLLKSNEKFDVVVLEQFVDDGLKVFSYHYNAPLVVFSTCASNAWVNPLVGNPAPPSYVPEQNIDFNHRNFFHRVYNFLIYVFGEINRNLIFFPAQNKIMKKYFPDAPDLDILIYNTSLILVNSDWSINRAVPRVPNMVDIGGFHIQPPKKLPKDLQDYLDGAKDGVIYFSMGSNLQSANLPKEKRDAILKVFSKLKMKVLWKWEDDVLPGQPDNVKLGKWLPQQDILAHPNIKLFITHGGLLSSTESIYHGVPVLAIPVFGDQVWNAADFARSGCGRYILYKDLTEAKLSEALNDVLNNPKYRENIKRRSRIMHDRRYTPIEDADYWIKYVVKHQGAAHLRVAGLDLAWYQYSCLDVVAFLLAISFTVFYVISKILRLVFKKLCGKTQSKEKTS